MVPVLKAPVLALFSLEFYRKVLFAPLSRGIVYLLYLSALASLVFLFILVSRALPAGDRFVEWFKQEMPLITWTPQGISISEQSPYPMFHPDYGNVIIFDTSRETMVREDMGEAVAYFTSTRLYMHRADGELVVRDLTGIPPNVKGAPQAVAIGPEYVDRYYASVKPLFTGIMTLVFFPVFYLWKFCAALFFSLFALILNRTRSLRLSYSAILNVCCFALTPAAVIQLLRLLVPPLNALPFGWFGSVLVTGGYLFFILKKTDAVPRDISPSDFENAG